MSSLLLTTPEQHDLDDPTVERNPRRVQKWLKELPLLNTVESLRLLRNALEPLNEQRMEARERLTLLDLYLPVARKLLEAVDPRQYAYRTLPGEQRRSCVEELERTGLALAGGYKILVREALLAPRPGAGLDIALARALEMLVRAMLKSYGFYRPLPPFLFLEINQLCRLALEHGLLQAPLSGESAGGATVGGCYHAAVLLPLADPFHLEEGEVERLFAVLLRYTNLCRLVPGAEPDLPEGCYRVDLCADRPARAAGSAPAPEDEAPAVVDARAAMHAMHRALLAMPAKERPASAEAALLRQLLPENPGGEQRRHAREATRQEVGLLLGLEAVHGSLVPGGASAAEAWQVLDTSAGGYRLHQAGTPRCEPRVGELAAVIVTREGVKPAPRLALVRWVKEGREGGTELGLECLEGTAAAVHCSAGDVPGESVPCLFLNASPEQTLSATLLAPKGLYVPGRELEIQVGGKCIPVRAARCVLETGCVERFEFAAR